MIRMLVLALTVFLLSNEALPATAQEAEPPPEQQLAERYVPVAYVRSQDHACATPPEGGEPYLPLPVEMVIDNERVLIRDRTDGDRVVATGPSSQELATYGPETYMDFPGDPRRPGCTYENDERIRIEEIGLKPTTYARIVFDADGQRLALQYWFFWYFNDWNNTHESDWEMIQLFWDEVGGVEEALDRSPDRVGYSQHGNGEMAEWGDSKLELEDETHPLVYPAAGSHATFFSNETFLAWGERNSGFGCDVSSGPSERVPLEVVVVPEDIDPEGEFAWLLYEGRWGERQPGSFNGPLGAGFNGRWIDPWEASDNWRPFSIVVPGSKALGPTMTDAFCGLTQAGSRALLATIVNPWIGLPVLGIAIAGLSLFAWRSKPLFLRSQQLYREHWKVFVGIGLVAIPIGILFNLLQAFLISRFPFRFVVEWFDGTAGARLSVVTAFGGVQQLAMLLFVAPAVIQAVSDITHGNPVSISRSYRTSTERLVPIAIAFLMILVLAGLPLLLVIGIPISIWLLVRWHFFAQSLVIDPTQTSDGALRESAALVKGRWWKTLFSVLIFDVLATVPGIVVGFGLLTMGGTAVGFANGVSSLFYALTIPIAVIAITLMYLDRRETIKPTPGAWAGD